MSGKDLLTVSAGRRLPAALSVCLTLAALLCMGSAPAAMSQVNSGPWTQQAELFPSDAGGAFGRHVAMDGSVAVVGAPGVSVGANFGQGAAYIFVNNGGVWTQQAELFAEDGASGDQFGWSVAINGNTVIVGATNRTVNGAAYQGAAYVFVNNGGSWSQTAELIATDGAPSDFFGTSVSVNGDTVVVGAPEKTINGNGQQGAAYVFVNNGGSWSQQTELIEGDGAAGDQFGNSVAGDANNIVVGAPYKTVNSNAAQGVTYFFAQNAGTWSQSGEIVASDGNVDGGFGYSVALSGTTAFIGCPNNLIFGAAIGSVYVYQLNSGTWNYSVELIASDSVAGNGFGESVSVDATSGVFAVGSPDTPIGSTSGAAYLFAQVNGAWTQLGEFSPSDAGSSDAFGLSVAVSGNTLIVGSPVHHTSTAEGAAYIYTDAPAQLQITQQPTTGTVDYAAGSVAVQVVDAVGSPLTLSGVPVTLASSPAGVSGTLTVNTVSGVATFSDLSFSSSGAFTLTATSPGLTSATSTSIHISALTQTISFGALSDQVLGAAPFTISATASSGLPVSFASLTGGVCTVVGNTVSLVAAGQCTIQATQAGNTQYAAATPVSQSFTVTSLTSQTISFGALANQVLGAAPFAITASASSGLPVSFASLTGGVCTVSGNTVSLVAAGLCTIQATQAGNATYAAATPVSQSFTVTSATLKTQTIKFPAQPNRVYGTPPFVITATATSGLPVTLTSLTPTICSVASEVTLLAGGTCSIEATQAGNAVYAAAAPITRSFTVTRAAQIILFPTVLQPSVSNTPVQLSATSSSGLAVTFTTSTTGVCAVTKDGLATFSHAGTCILTAKQPGDADYLAATPVTESITVARAYQTITFPAIPNQTFNPKIIRIPLTATSSSGLKVSFRSLTPLACGIALDTATGNYMAVLLAKGVCTIEANQPGDPDYYRAAPVDQRFTIQ